MAKVIAAARKAERSFDDVLQVQRDAAANLEKKIREQLEDLRRKDQIISDLRRELDKAKLTHHVDELKLSKDDRQLLLGAYEEKVA